MEENSEDDMWEEPEEQSEAPEEPFTEPETPMEENADEDNACGRSQRRALTRTSWRSISI